MSSMMVSLLTELMEPAAERVLKPTKARRDKPPKPTVETLSDQGSVFRASTMLQLGPEKRKPGDLLKEPKAKGAKQ